MSLTPLWPVVQQYQNKNGTILTGGRIYIYYQGRTALATTYHDEEGTVVNANPVLLDNNGRATVFANTIYSYTIVVCDYYGKELFSQDITLHDAISSAEDVIVIGSNGTVKVDTTTLPNGVQYDLSVNTDIIATKKSVDDVKTDLNNLTGKVDNHTTQIEQIQEDINGIDSSLAKKKDKQNELNFNGSATKTVKSITQNANGELNVEFEDIDLPQSVPNVEITSEDSSVNITASVDAETNTKTFDLSVDSITNIASSDGSINVSSTDGNVNLTLPSDVVRDSAYTHIDAATANPLMDGITSVGVSTKYAREDHIHPTDTSREAIANKTTVILGTSDIKYPTDKAVAEFVNSSIATNTANYISNNGNPFTSVEQLNAYTGTVTNNDYAFVTGIDSEGNTYYDRYKATVNDSSITWALEYRLNNNSFTAAQWSAINSGITSVLVAKIHDHSNKDVLDGITSSDVDNWNSKQNSLTAGDNITIDGNTISSDQVFVAEYGTTTYQEIKDAHDAGKICFIFRNELYYYINLIETNRIRFISLTPNPAFGMLTVYRDGGWEASNSWLQSRLTFDSAPKAGSNNPVTSDGIRTMKPVSHRFDNENLSRLIVWGKANSKGYINDMVRKFGLKYGSITDLLFTNSVHKDDTKSVIIKILNDSGISTASTIRLKASIFKDSSENSYFALWLDGSISQPGWAYYVDYYPDVSEQDSTVRRFTVFNTSEYTLVRDLTIKYIPLALPSQSKGVLTSDGSSNSWLTPPASGTAVLKSVNGVIQWVTE